MEPKIRKLENNLITIGTGIIVLSAWTFFKILMFVIVSWEEIAGNIEPYVALIAASVVLFIVFVDFLIHLFIGLSARNEGKGIIKCKKKNKKKRNGYLVLLGIIIFLNSAAIIGEFIYLFIQKQDGSLSSVITMVIDLTSLMIMCDLMISAIKLRKLKKQRTAKEGSEE